MTQQLRETLDRTAVLANNGSMVRGQGNGPVFFFDGEFRTQHQLEQRAQLNRAIAAYILSGTPR